MCVTCGIDWNPSGQHGRLWYPYPYKTYYPKKVCYQPEKEIHSIHWSAMFMIIGPWTVSVCLTFWLPQNSWQLCTTKGLFTLGVRGILRLSGDTEKYQEFLRKWWRLNGRTKCQNRLQCLRKICSTLLQVSKSASNWQNLRVPFADSYIYLHIFL